MSKSIRRHWLHATALAVLATIAAGCNFELSNQAEAKDEWKKTYTLGPGATLEIRNTNGSVDVTPASGSAIEIVAERIAHGATDQAAKNALAELAIRETATATSVTLDSTSHGINFIGRSPEVKYHVKVPRGTNVRLSGTNQEISVADIDGALDAQSTNGQIHATGLSNAVTASTTNGDIDLSFNKLADTGVSCETTNGEVSILLPHDAHARISASVTNGSIRTENMNLNTTQTSSRKLEATLGGGGPLVHLSTTNGDVRVKGQ